MEIGTETHHGKFRGVPHLVAEETISLHAQDVEIDVAPLGRVGAEGEAEGVRSTFWNSIGIISCLAEFRLFYFFRLEIPAQQLLVKT